MPQNPPFTRGSPTWPPPEILDFWRKQLPPGTVLPPGSIPPPVGTNVWNLGPNLERPELPAPEEIFPRPEPILEKRGTPFATAPTVAPSPVELAPRPLTPAPLYYTPTTETYEPPPPPEPKAPQRMIRAKVDPASINFEGEEPWLAEILNTQWQNLPVDWSREELANYPREALKAILFFQAQGPDLVSFNDQMMSGHQAAMSIVNSVRQDFLRQDDYNRSVDQWFARKKRYDEIRRRQIQQTPLPFRSPARVM